MLFFPRGTTWPSLRPLHTNSIRHKRNDFQQLHRIRIFILYTKACMNKYNWEIRCKGTREEMTDRRSAVRRQREGDVDNCELNTELNDWSQERKRNLSSNNCLLLSLFTAYFWIHFYPRCTCFTLSHSVLHQNALLLLLFCQCWETYWNQRSASCLCQPGPDYVSLHEMRLDRKSTRKRFRLDLKCRCVSSCFHTQCHEH